MRVRARPEPPPRPLSLSSAPGGGLLSLVCPSHEGNGLGVWVSRGHTRTKAGRGESAEPEGNPLSPPCSRGLRR